MVKEKPFKKFHLKLAADVLKWNGMEPTWEASQITDSNLNSMLVKGFNWYNSTTDKKHCKHFLEDYIKVFRPTTADADIKLLNKVPEKYLNSTDSALARMAIQGFPLSESQKDRIWNGILAGLDKKSSTDDEAERAVTVPKLGVQERMDLQVSEVFDSIEDSVNDILKGVIKDAKSNHVVGLDKFSAVHFKKLSKLIEPLLNDMLELQRHRADAPTDDWGQQLLEAYEYTSNKAIKSVIAFLEDCQGLANKLAIEKKVQRIRKKKPTDRAKLVSKFKYMPEFAELKLVSAKPVELLGSSEVWVYDTKKRKMGVYRSEFAGSIMVKGTTLVGVREKLCIQKTLRKPAVQLADFMKLNKNQLNKWFSEIKGTEHQMKPRSNENLVILKVIQ